MRAHLPMCFGMHVPTLSTAFTYTHCRSKRDTRLRSENEIALCFYKCISADFIAGGEMYRAYLKHFKNKKLKRKKEKDLSLLSPPPSPHIYIFFFFLKKKKRPVCRSFLDPRPRPHPYCNPPFRHTSVFNLGVHSPFPDASG